LPTREQPTKADAACFIASFLQSLKGGKVPLEIHVRGKDAEQNAEQLRKIAETIKNSGKKVGILSKEDPTGQFAEEWKTAFGAIKNDVEEVDMSIAISTAALSVKDEKELRAIRDASRASSSILASYFVDEMSEIIDQEKKVSHSALSDKVQNKIDDSKFFQKLKVSANFDPMQLDWATIPVVYSGGKYDLKFNTDPDEKNLHSGVIVSALGLRYKSYVSLVARTYLVDPSKSQENNYKLLASIHETVLKSIRDGVPANEVYKKALALLKSKKPELEKHFIKNVGWGAGIESKDNTLLLNAKNTRVLKDGMTLCVVTGLADLENPSGKDSKSKTYSLVIADTVRVTANDPANFTKDAPSDTDSIAFFFNDEEEPAPKKKPQKDSRAGAIAKTNIQATRLRAERSANQDAEKEAARRVHQKELHVKKQQQGMERFEKKTRALNGAEEKKFKKFESYKRDNQLPAKVKDLIIVLDPKSQTIVLPIMGRPVPFHIHTVKNASTTVEGEFTSLRINFLSPGQGVGRKDDQPFEDPTAHFIRSLTFRSRDKDRMDSILTGINDMKKESVRREQEKKQLEDVVEQDKLIIGKSCLSQHPYHRFMANVSRSSTSKARHALRSACS
jgi:nucleosome binding factor SPN SPT16 subunit